VLTKPSARLTAAGAGDIVKKSREHEHPEIKVAMKSLFKAWKAKFKQDKPSGQSPSTLLPTIPFSLSLLVCIGADAKDDDASVSENKPPAAPAPPASTTATAMG
jgi:hypothetical protein